MAFAGIAATKAVREGAAGKDQLTAEEEEELTDELDGAVMQSYETRTAGFSKADKVRFALWQAFEEPESSRVAHYVSVFIMLTIAVSIGSFLASSWPRGGCDWNQGSRTCPGASPHNGATRGPGANGAGERVGDLPAMKLLESICVWIFSAEYLTRLLTCTTVMPLRSFVFNLLNTIDLLAIMPWYLNLILKAAKSSGDARFVGVLRIVRLVRVVRVFKASKNFQGMHVLLRTIKRSGMAIIILFSVSMMFSLVFGTLVYMIEGGDYKENPSYPGVGSYVRIDNQPTPFESIPDSIYWTMVTMTTVGYGDMSPISPIGYVVGVLTILGGLITLSLPITIISANFDEEARIFNRMQTRQKRKTALAAKEEAESREAAGLPAKKPTLTDRIFRRKKLAEEAEKAAADSGERTRIQAHDDFEQLDQDIQASLTAHRAAVANDLQGMLQRMQQELAEHSCKVVVLSDVLKKSRKPHARPAS